MVVWWGGGGGGGRGLYTFFSGTRTFSVYANKILLSFIEAHLKTANRLDVVWDRYFPNSLPNTTREKRGSGVRRKVTSNGPLPVKWSTLLRCSENKLELFSFLTAELTQRVKNNILVMTDDGNVYSNGVLDLNNLMPCDIEEADERIFLHVKHIAQEYHKILIKTVDSDVVVIALSVFHRILGISELWIDQKYSNSSSRFRNRTREMSSFTVYSRI